MKILLLLLLAVPAFGQLDYSVQPTNKEAAVRMHFAIKLFRGVNKEQEEFLLRAIRDRRTISEVEAAKLFTREELRDVFFGIGRTDISLFRQLYDAQTIREKKEIWKILNADEKVDARRVNFAWGVGYLGFNDIQIDYLLRLSKALPGIGKTELREFEDEALLTFPDGDGKLLFGSIGPYVKTKCTPNVFVPNLPTTNLLQRNCFCSVGSSFNMSCSGTCSSGGCNATQDGCGFAWIFACDGTCNTE